MIFLESYKSILLKISFLSKITTSLLIGTLLFYVSKHFYSYIFLADTDLVISILKLILLSDGFLTLICGFFIVRFIFLWSKKPKSIWFSQLFWLVGWLTILAYRLVTQIYLQDMDKSIQIYSENFLGISHLFGSLLLTYLYLSPIKQTLVLLSAIFSKKPLNLS
jgi:hypothetical protein